MDNHRNKSPHYRLVLNPARSPKNSVPARSAPRTPLRPARNAAAPTPAFAPLRARAEKQTSPGRPSCTLSHTPRSRHSRAGAGDNRRHAPKTPGSAPPGIPAGALPRYPGFPSRSYLASKFAGIPDLLEIARVKANHLVRDQQRDQKIDRARHPLREQMHPARPLLMIIGLQAAQRFIQRAADFAGVILRREQLGEAMRIVHQL